MSDFDGSLFLCSSITVLISLQAGKEAKSFSRAHGFNNSKISSTVELHACFTTATMIFWANTGRSLDSSGKQEAIRSMAGLEHLAKLFLTREQKVSDPSSISSTHFSIFPEISSSFSSKSGHFALAFSAILITSRRRVVLNFLFNNSATSLTFSSDELLESSFFALNEDSAYQEDS